MGLFGKKEEKKNINLDSEVPRLPELPELPRLPESPRQFSNNSMMEEPLQQLPSYPSNSFADKFSQSAIKDAVSGEEEVGEVENADDFAEDEMQMMQEPPRKSMTKEIYGKPIDRKVPKQFREASRVVREAEPIFIRIDKFEDAMKTFDKIKLTISEIEKELRDIKKIKEAEEEELQNWEEEINSAKEQVEKIDSEIFSKIE